MQPEPHNLTTTFIQKLFTTPLNGYDAIIRMSPQKCSRFRENIWFDSSCLPQTAPKYRNLISAKDRESALISKIDTVGCYLSEVSASFRDVAWFFVDPYGGDAVAVVWKTRDSDFKWKVDAKFNFVHQEIKVSSFF